MNTYQPNDLSDNQLHALMMKIAGIVICTLFVCITSCSIHSDYRVSQAVEKSTDPVATACALNNRIDICALAAKGTK